MMGWSPGGLGIDVVPKHREREDHTRPEEGARPIGATLILRPLLLLSAG